MYFSPLEQFDAIGLTATLLYKDNGSIFCDASLFNIMLPLILIIVYIIIIFFSLEDNCLLIPTSFQYFFETLIRFIFNIIKQQVGHNGYVFFPFIFTLFNFILFANLLSLIPFGIALTSHIILMM